MREGAFLGEGRFFTREGDDEGEDRRRSSREAQYADHVALTCLKKNGSRTSAKLDDGKVISDVPCNAWVSPEQVARPRHVGGPAEVRDRFPPASRWYSNESGRFQLPHSVRGLHSPAGAFQGKPRVIQPAGDPSAFAERLALALGLIGLVSWGGFQFRTTASTHHDLEQFAGAGPVALVAQPHQRLAPAISEPARRRWRCSGSRSSDSKWRCCPAPTNARSSAAVGHIEDTALPGTDGNSGIAGHRDGFFRGLKDIAPGDVIELDTRSGTAVYRVERTWVVDPEDVSVLDPTPTAR